MARVVTIPAAGDLLCEGCGYVLNGLAAGARCPECGKPTDESSPLHRRPTDWELTPVPSFRAFLQVTFALWVSPARFFRGMLPDPANARSRQFSQLHAAIASILLGLSAWAHLDWFMSLGGGGPLLAVGQLPILLGTVLGAFFLLAAVTRLAARLTTWEGAYRGLRLPLSTVQRALQYHAAHYVPVGVVAAATVLGYRVLLVRGVLSGATGLNYLYALCAEVILAAAYLFSTYWTAMRNLMYANR